MGFLTKLMPARRKAQDVRVVANLDDIISRSTVIVLHGKEHVIEPLELDRFLKWSEALAGLFVLKEKKGLTPDELLDGYTRAFQTVCPTISKADLEKATQAQIAGLYGLILEHVSGKAHTEDGAAKKLMGPQTQSPSIGN